MVTQSLRALSRRSPCVVNASVALLFPPRANPRPSVRRAGPPILYNGSHGEALTLAVLLDQR